MAQDATDDRPPGDGGDDLQGTLVTTRVFFVNPLWWASSCVGFMVDMPQIFLPFAVGGGGRTLYEHVQTNPGFLLGDGSQ